VHGAAFDVAIAFTATQKRSRKGGGGEGGVDDGSEGETPPAPGSLRWLNKLAPTTKPLLRIVSKDLANIQDFLRSCRVVIIDEAHKCPTLVKAMCGSSCRLDVVVMSATPNATLARAYQWHSYELSLTPQVRRDLGFAQLRVLPNGVPTSTEFIRGYWSEFSSCICRGDVDSWQMRSIFNHIVIFVACRVLAGVESATAVLPPPVLRDDAPIKRYSALILLWNATWGPYDQFLRALATLRPLQQRFLDWAIGAVAGSYSVEVAEPLFPAASPALDLFREWGCLSVQRELIVKYYKVHTYYYDRTTKCEDALQALAPSLSAILVKSKGNLKQLAATICSRRPDASVTIVNAELGARRSKRVKLTMNAVGDKRMVAATLFRLAARRRAAVAGGGRGEKEIGGLLGRVLAIGNVCNLIVRSLALPLIVLLADASMDIGYNVHGFVSSFLCVEYDDDDDTLRQQTGRMIRINVAEKRDLSVKTYVDCLVSYREHTAEHFLFTLRAERMNIAL
jgi:hypothetical protein